MANLAGFDATVVEPNAGFDPLPPGEYEATIVASEFKQTKNGDGEYLSLEVKILSGQYQNRVLYENLNLKNRNEQAVQIAKGTLSAICRAVNVLTPNDSSELHMKPLRISVGTRKREDTGEMQNYIKGFKPRSAQPAPVSRAPATESMVTSPKAPWVS